MARWCLLVFMLGSGFAYSEGLKIKRFSQDGDNYIRVLVEIEGKVKIKCAVYDKDGEPLRVESKWVSGPLDDMLMATGASTAAVSSIKCWIDK